MVLRGRGCMIFKGERGMCQKDEKQMEDRYYKLTTSYLPRVLNQARIVPGSDILN